MKIESANLFLNFEIKYLNCKLLPWIRVQYLRNFFLILPWRYNTALCNEKRNFLLHVMALWTLFREHLNKNLLIKITPICRNEKDSSWKAICVFFKSFSLFLFNQKIGTFCGLLSVSMQIQNCCQTVRSEGCERTANKMIAWTIQSSEELSIYSFPQM